MVLATHWLTTLIPTCNPRITQCAALSSGPGREDTDANMKSFGDQNSLCAFERTVNLCGEVRDDEKLEGGCGPPIWRKCAVTSDDAGHFGGSSSWHSDPLTGWWI